MKDNRNENQMEGFKQRIGRGFGRFIKEGSSYWWAGVWRNTGKSQAGYQKGMMNNDNYNAYTELEKGLFERVLCGRHKDGLSYTYLWKSVTVYYRPDKLAMDTKNDIALFSLSFEWNEGKCKVGFKMKDCPEMIEEKEWKKLNQTFEALLKKYTPRMEAVPMKKPTVNVNDSIKTLASTLNSEAVKVESKPKKVQTTERTATPQSISNFDVKQVIEANASVQPIEKPITIEQTEVVKTEVAEVPMIPASELALQKRLKDDGISKAYSTSLFFELLYEFYQKAELTKPKFISEGFAQDKIFFKEGYVGFEFKRTTSLDFIKLFRTILPNTKVYQTYFQHLTPKFFYEKVKEN